MQTMILGGIAAVLCWVAWRRHNRLLDEQAEASGRALKPVPVGFDYQAAREQADRMEDNLRQYEQCNQLINDSVVAIQTGESMPIEITHFDNEGRRVHTPPCLCAMQHRSSSGRACHLPSMPGSCQRKTSLLVCWINP